MTRPYSRLLPLVGLCFGVGLAGGCRPAPGGASSDPAPVVVKSGPAAEGVAVGERSEQKPWVTHVLATDLDKNGRPDVLVCEGRQNTVSWLRPTGLGTWDERVLAKDIPGPVHTDVVDWDGDGDQDIWVASMGVIFPNNERVGSIVFLENLGGEQFRPRVLEEHIARVTDVRAVDLNGDGRLDLAVAQFGYDQGEVRWLEQRPDGAFLAHPLLDRSGAINICVADFTGDRFPDLAVVLAQQWEEVLLFENDGRGEFKRRTLFASTNEDFGSSGLVTADLNQDGRPDLLLTNGDGFDYAEPGARPWHGVQWLENRGHGQFVSHRVGDLPGAYAPTAVDWNADGRLDILAVSGFNRWEEAQASSMVVFLQGAEGRFSPQVLAKAPTHLLTAAAADFEQRGRSTIITGGFHAYPPYTHMSRLMWWRPTGQP